MSRSNYWWQLRLFWLYWVIRTSLFLGAVMTLLITIFTLLFTGVATFDLQMVQAVWQLAAFWFYVVWSLAFLISLILSFQKLFTKSFSGYRALMLECKTKEVKAEVSWQDVLPLWRKFLFLMIWAYAIFAFAIMKLCDLDLHDLGGFKIFGFIMVAGALLLQPLLLSLRNVRIRRN